MWISWLRRRWKVRFYSEYDEQFQAVALLVLLVLVLDVLIVERKNPLFKNIKLFRK